MIDRATTVVIDCLDELATGGHPLVAGDPSGALATALAARGVITTAWHRRAVAGANATPWPPAGPFTSALVRLPKEKTALVFALHAVASVTPPGASIVVFGANEQGVRSTAPHLAAVAGPVATLATRRHCRVIAGPRLAEIPGLKCSLPAWREEREFTLLGRPRRWVSYPGVFAKGALDEGTALLVAHLPRLARGTRVLDFAAGTGVVAAALLAQQSEAQVDLVEIDALALAAAAENVPAARLIAGDSLAATGATRYDAILSNPPIHNGVAEDHDVLKRLIAEAPRHLAAGGDFRIVVQRRIAATAAEQIAAAFGSVAIIAETGRFRVLGAQKRR